jgi:threonine synthase
VLQVIRETDGAALRVTDTAILEAQSKLGHRGFMVEPTSAVPVAALDSIRRVVGADAEIVIPLTGSGLKNLRT